MKKLVIVMAVVMAMIMTVTGCNSSKNNYNEYETFRCCKKMADEGFCSGYVHCTRYGAYGSNAYEYTVSVRDYKKAKGEKVSKVSAEVVNGELVWYFISIAE